MSLSERQVAQSGSVMWFASLAFFRRSNILSGWYVPSERWYVHAPETYLVMVPAYL